VPSIVKRVLGGTMFVIVLAYILIAGRGSNEAQAVEWAAGVDRMPEGASRRETVDRWT
jgi:hypothetical protein